MMYDLMIIGSGPAGLTASIYASRYKLSNLVIGKLLGGTITHAYKVENFPGFKEISGLELGQKMVEQAKSLGAEIMGEEVVRVEIIKNDAEIGESFNVHLPGAPQAPHHLEGGKRLAESHISPRRFKIVSQTNKEFEGKAIIVATGTERRKLNIPGEKEYLGKGVSYCVTCDAAFFKDKIVVLIGGSNAACSGALHLANFAKKIYLICRKSELRAEPVWVEEVKENSKIEVIYETNITKILGVGEIRGVGSVGENERVGGVELNKPHNKSNILLTDGVFIEIGGMPAGEFLRPLGVEFNEDGYVKVSEKMETNISGIFAAGDVTDKSLILSQAITACGLGAIAANSVFEYLKS